ncbi:uncharacterized protein LOC111693750 [Trichogramma pretiosum]|uniref:uncharacterized protein LOC111693750 n=1 Tax=Trichogramma pretiosum TaxID=7493 RepID=UPI000C71A55C|nr:uncharacterized protein LOC111693750 [Trichogramma pretiosum]
MVKTRSKEYNDFKEWKRIHTTINSEEDQLKACFSQLYNLIRNCKKDAYPNFLAAFSNREIETLLIDCMIHDSRYNRGSTYKFKAEKVIEFVANSGYKDEPDVDKDGNPLLNRTTALLFAFLHYRLKFWKSRLFDIYNNFDVNYIHAKTGVTHFHVACSYGLENIVEKFIERGQGPNCHVQGLVFTPLLLALKWGCEKVIEKMLNYDPKLVNAQDEEGNPLLYLALGPTRFNRAVIELLLERGADPNLANAKGWTPLHLICADCWDDDAYVKQFFEIVDSHNQTVEVDAKDKLGRTPLQWAVARLAPKIIDVLLDRGADLSSFVFPTEVYFAKHVDIEYGNLGNPNVAGRQWPIKKCEIVPLILGARTMDTVERLEKRGYELDQGVVLMIMTLFSKRKMFEEPTNDKKSWYYKKNFVSQAKNIAMKPGLSLYDLIPLQPKEAAKLLAYEDYLSLDSKKREIIDLPKGSRKECSVHLCEKLSRGFFRRWALEYYLEMIRYRLPIECCEMIIDESFTNKNLYHICLAAKTRALKIRKYNSR